MKLSELPISSIIPKLKLIDSAGNKGEVIKILSYDNVDYMIFIHWDYQDPNINSHIWHHWFSCDSIIVDHKSCFSKLWKILYGLLYAIIIAYDDAIGRYL